MFQINAYLLLTCKMVRATSAWAFCHWVWKPVSQMQATLHSNAEKQDIISVNLSDPTFLIAPYNPDVISLFLPPPTVLSSSFEDLKHYRCFYCWATNFISITANKLKTVKIVSCFSFFFILIFFFLYNSSLSLSSSS